MENGRHEAPPEVANPRTNWAQQSEFELDEHLYRPESLSNNNYNGNAFTSREDYRDSQVGLLPTPGSSAFVRSPGLVAVPSNDPLLGQSTHYDRKSPQLSTQTGSLAEQLFPRKWHENWNMYIFLLFGIACAVGHHVFYNALDGQPADNQIQMLRYGTLLAFAAKAGFGAAVVTAYRQRVWTTVRTRLLSVGALDSLFAASEEFMALWNWELFRKARTAMGLAIFVWIAPLVVILTANTLLVEGQTMIQNTTCPGVRTLNFTFEETNDWRSPVLIDGLYEVPLSLWNSTKPQAQNPPGWFDYYTAPAPIFLQTSTMGAFSEEVVARKNASMEICGSGWNCTYTIQFIAPGFKCKELASGVGSKAANLTQESGSIAPPFGTDILLPKGKFSYYAFTSGGEYSTMQMADVGIGGVPNTKPPYPKNLGAFRTEPVVWIGYAVLADPTAEPPNKPSDPNWNTTFVPKLFACENYETAYTAVFEHVDAAQTATVTNRTYLRPVINTTFVPDRLAQDGTADNTTATPTANYVLPSPSVGHYRRTAAYHSLGLAVRNFLNGTVELGGLGLVNPIANTAAIQTKLLDPRNNFFPHRNLPDLVQSFYEDVILSLLSNPHFVAVTWAAQPGEESGGLAHGGGNDTAQQARYAYPCGKSRTAIVYRYHARDLWIVYGLAILLTALGVGVGAHAAAENEGSAAPRDTRFSSVVAATRGGGLDRVVGEQGGHVPKQAKGMRAGYGLIPRGGGVTPLPGDGGAAYDSPTKLGSFRYGFGLEGEVQQARSEGWRFRMSRR